MMMILHNIYIYIYMDYSYGTYWKVTKWSLLEANHRSMGHAEKLDFVPSSKVPELR